MIRCEATNKELGNVRINKRRDNVNFSGEETRWGTGHSKVEKGRSGKCILSNNPKGRVPRALPVGECKP